MAVAVLATLAVALAVPMEPLPRALLGATILLMGLRARTQLRAPRALVLEPGAIHLLDEGGWRTGVVRPGCFVAPWLTVIRWRPEGAWRDHAAVLLPGAADAETLRKIRVLLRCA